MSLLLFLAGCCTPPPEEAYYPYDDPLSSPGAKFAGLPPAVQKTIRAQAGAALMYDIEKFPGPGTPVYEVVFRDPVYPRLYVSSDGSVLYPDLSVAVGAPADTFGVSSGQASGVKLQDLPKNVVSRIQESAPTSEVGLINKITVEDKTFYEVYLKDASHKPLLLDEEGTLVDHLPVEVPRSVPLPFTPPKSQPPPTAQ